jgi:hypothetical protein
MACRGSGVRVPSGPPKLPVEHRIFTRHADYASWAQFAAQLKADSYRAATISDDRIDVNWVNDADSTKVIYWVGTYSAPSEDTETYLWESQADAAALQRALLASSSGVDP